MSTDKTPENWTATIMSARKHPGGIKAYCEKQGISLPSYYIWFKKLRPLHPEWSNTAGRPASKPSFAKKEKAVFVPVKVVTEKRRCQDDSRQRFGCVEVL